MGINWKILFLMGLTIFSIAFFNSSGIATTKYASAAQRSTIDTSRTFLIWIMSVLLGLESWKPWEIPGFVFLVCGTLLYNEIVIVPYLGFDQYTKIALAKKAGLEDRAANRAGAAEVDQSYMTSPGAAKYGQANRNQRALQAGLDAQMNAGLTGGDDFDIKQDELDLLTGVQNNTTEISTGNGNYDEDK